MYVCCVLFSSFVLSHSLTLNKIQPAQEMKNVNSENDDATLKSMKLIHFLHSSCFYVCHFIMHIAFMYVVSMIWKEQGYDVKHDATAESLLRKQALLMFYLSLCFLLRRMIFLLSIELQSLEIKSSGITAASKNVNAE